MYLWTYGKIEFEERYQSEIIAFSEILDKEDSDAGILKFSLKSVSLLQVKLARLRP